MFKFCRLVAGLLLSLTVLIGMAPLIGGAQSAPLAMLFTKPDGTPCQRPCLFGVQPGLTSYTQAVELLRNHPFTRTFQSEGIRNMFSDESLSVILSLDANDRVSGVTLISYSNSSPLARLGSLGNMLALLGVPNTVERDVGYLQSYYLEDHLSFSHQLTPGDLTFNEPCRQISVYLAAPGIMPVAGPGEPMGHAMSWHDFRKVESQR
jgi:hypothetical protein